MKYKDIKSSYFLYIFKIIIYHKVTYLTYLRKRFKNDRELQNINYDKK